MDCFDYRSSVIGVDTCMPTTKGCLPRVFFNNGATDLILKTVRDKFNELLPYYTYTGEQNAFSDEITKMYEEVRETILDYVGAAEKKDVVLYTKNGTEAMNVLANCFSQAYEDQVILTTKMEHLANYLPYKERMNTVLINVTSDGEIDLEDYIFKLKKYKRRVKLVAVTGATNVTGVMPPIEEMAKLAHAYGAKIFVDIVQLLQHKPFSMKPHNDPSHIDFVAFSSHKCYTGLDGGALIGDAEFLSQYLPLEFGAGIVKFITDRRIIYQDVPIKYEAGYPDILGVICMGEALKWLKCAGIENISHYEKYLYAYLIEGLKTIPNMRLYAQDNVSPHIPFVAFNIEGIPFSEVSKRMGYDYGINITSGTIGSPIYVQNLLGLSNEEAYRLYLEGKSYGVIRISLSFYNTYEEVDYTICALKEIVYRWYQKSACYYFYGE